MKNKKFIILSIIILTVLLCLGACLKDATKIETLYLSDDDHSFNPIPLGKFAVTSISNDQYAKEYGIRPKDNNAFIEFLQHSEYYIGTYNVSADSYYVNKTNRCKIIKGGDECFWFTAQDNVWIGKFYTNKYFYMAYIPMTMLKSDSIFIDITEAIFTGDEKPQKVGVEYKCPLTWEQLKKIYSSHKIDEDNCTIELNCYLYSTVSPTTPFGKTLLYFDKDNNTVKISDDYEIDENGNYWQ
ncbi:MAG: hypothetical protein OSJ74_01035 [Clostridia bacterium]|nr:hypothetical protein [Clostridia bacterium]